MSALQQILVPAMLVFILAGSLLGAAIGAGLLMRSERAAAFVQLMNRWVSTRRVLRPVELPREAVALPGRLLGAVLLLAGGYALAVLATVPVSRVAALLRVDGTFTLGLMGIEAAKWLLVAGCAVAVVSGVLLVFFPQAWRKVESVANRWYSSRRITAGGDDMHTPLDRAASAFPRAAGGVILLLSLASGAACALLLARL